MMNCFTTYLSLNLLVKEFLKLVNIWRSYRQNGDCCMSPFCLAFLSSKMLISPDRLNNLYITTKTVANRCDVNRQINVSLLSTISNCCRPVLTYWLTDWRHQWLTDCWSCTAFCRDSFFFVAAVVYSGSWDFLYGRCKQLFCLWVK